MSTTTPAPALINPISTKPIPKQDDLWEYTDGPNEEPNRKKVQVRLIEQGEGRYWLALDTADLSTRKIHESKLNRLVSRRQQLILCTPKEKLPLDWSRTGFTKLSWTAFTFETLKLPFQFVARDEAENNEELVQWIPYCAITDRNKTFTYARKGAEARLHGQRTIGIGGHVDEGDGIPDFAGIPEYVMGALARELREEIYVPRSEVLGTKMTGIIMEQVNPVGRVHIGVAFVRTLVSQSVAGREEIFDSQWMRLEELVKRRSEFEMWSQLFIDNLL